MIKEVEESYKKIDKHSASPTRATPLLTSIATRAWVPLISPMTRRSPLGSAFRSARLVRCHFESMYRSREWGFPGQPIPRQHHGPRAIDEVEEPIPPKKLQKCLGPADRHKRVPETAAPRESSGLLVIATPVPRFSGCTKICEFSAGANSSRENLVCLCQDGHRVITWKWWPEALPGLAKQAFATKDTAETALVSLRRP